MIQCTKCKRELCEKGKNHIPVPHHSDGTPANKWCTKKTTG